MGVGGIEQHIMFFWSLGGCGAPYGVVVGPLTGTSCSRPSDSPSEVGRWRQSGVSLGDARCVAASPSFCSPLPSPGLPLALFCVFVAVRVHATGTPAARAPVTQRASSARRLESPFKITLQSIVSLSSPLPCSLPSSSSLSFCLLCEIYWFGRLGHSVGLGTQLASKLGRDTF